MDIWLRHGHGGWVIDICIESWVIRHMYEYDAEQHDRYRISGSQK